MNQMKTQRNPFIVLLYVFPVLYLILGIYFRQIFGDLSLRSFDPDYIHFLSGLCVSTGKFSQANIDHPASALHLLLAVVFRVVYVFRSHDVAYFQDVIRNSDFYLAIGNLVMTAMITVTMLWAGKEIFKISKSYVYAVLIQTAPFLMNIWYDLFGRVYVELLLVIPVFMMEVLMFKEIYGRWEHENRKSFYYGFTVGLGLSLKMTLLPLMFLPLFLLKGVREKLKFLLFTAVSFSILALPVISQFQKFFRWTTGLFLHSGFYQQGAKTIIHFDVFAKNFTTLSTSQQDFFYALILLVVLFVIIQFTKRKHPVFNKIDLGLFLTLLAITFIACKHFELRYFIPALLFYPLLLILIKEHILQFDSNRNLNVLMSFLLLLIVGYNLYQQVPYIRVVSKSVEGQMAARIQTRNVVSTLPEDRYKIIVSQDYGSPFQEYSIMYAFCVAGQNWPGYKAKLDKMYPDTYQYFTWNDELKYWGMDFNPDTVMASGKPVYLYLEKNTQALYERTIHKLFGHLPELSISKKLIFENPVNGEVVLQLFLSKND